MSELVRIHTILSGTEFMLRNKQAMDNGKWHTDPTVFTPGTLWMCPWIFNPLGESVDHVMIDKEPLDIYAASNYLSPYYWRDWSMTRPPICIMGPNGDWWEIDRRSSNGDGWKVTYMVNDLMHITCHPSIVLKGYHGFLTNGEFSADVEGRGPIGIPLPYTPRTKEHP